MNTNPLTGLTRWIAMLCLCAALPAGARAQMRVEEGDEFLQTAGLKLGDLVPDVKGYGIDGQELGLRDLKGSYTVLVFGCLT